MADTTIEYVIKLQDQISGTLARIENNTKGMNKAMEHSKGIAGELKTAFIEFFAIEKVFEFLKEGFAEFQKDALATANLETGIRNLHGTLGLTSEALKQQREELSKHSLASQTTIKEAQAMLTSFQSVHGDIFKNAIPAIADLSTKMGGDMVGAARAVGMALDNPAEGLNRLRRQGVMFTESQRIMIENLDKTGHHAQAQAEILKLLESRFHGAAQAAADANPWKVFQNQIEETMIKVGASISKIGMNFMPVLQKILNELDPIINELMSIFETVLPPIIDLLNPIMQIFKVIFTIVKAIVDPIVKSLRPALEDIKGVVDIIAKNFQEMGPTIAKIAGFLGKVLGFILQVAVKIAVVQIKFNDWLMHTKLFKGIWDTIMWVVEKVMKGITWVIEKTKELFGMNEGLSATSAAAKENGAKEGGEGMDITAGGAMNSPSSVMESRPKEAKATNIYITIGDLVKNFTIQTSNLAMSEGQIKEFIVKTFMGAVNGFNLIPGQ